MSLVLALVVLAVLAAYLAWPLWAWSLAALVVLVGWSLAADPSSWGLVMAWLLVLTPLLLLNLRPLRRALITRHVLAWFARVLPPISDTEREAIAAGGTWWEAELYNGRPDYDQLLQLQMAELTPEELEFLNGPVETLCDMLDGWDIEQRGDLPPEVWDFIREQGFLAMIIPRRFGGLEFSALAHSAVVMKIAAKNQTAAVTVMVPNSLGPGELLLHFGTEAQQQHYLPRLAAGEEIPCFALTGPDAGSDAAAMTDVGVVVEREIDGQKVLGFELSWDKRYITLAPVATVLGLAFKARDPHGLLGDREELGITCALLPVDTPGVQIGRRHRPGGAVFMNGPTRGENVFMPLDHVIGGRERIGQGWRMLMYSLAVGRSISLPALSTGCARQAVATTTAYAALRHQFKLPIGRFEGVSEQIAAMAIDAHRMECGRRLAMTALDVGEKPVVVSAILKYELTEAYRRTIQRAMDVHAGKAVIEGPRNYLAQVYQAVPIAITVEGANILTRTLIIFGQGAIRCHRYLLSEMEAAGDYPERGALQRFDDAFFSHIGLTVSNAVRASLLGWTRGRTAGAPAGAWRRDFQRLAHLSAAFYTVADLTLLTLGGRFKMAESLSGRLADALSHLFLASAVLKQASDQPAALTRLALDDSFHRIEAALRGVLENHPSALAGAVLRRLVFPFGPVYRAPSDQACHALTAELLADGPARRAVVRGIHLQGTGPAADVERAFAAWQRTQATRHAVRNALGREPRRHDVAELAQAAVDSGVITPAQANEMVSAFAARAEVIAVDSFEPDHFVQDCKHVT